MVVHLVIPVPGRRRQVDLCVLLGSQFSLIGESQVNGNRVDSILREMLPVWVYVYIYIHTHICIVKSLRRQNYLFLRYFGRSTFVTVSMLCTIWGVQILIEYCVEFVSLWVCVYAPMIVICVSLSLCYSESYIPFSNRILFLFLCTVSLCSPVWHEPSE